MASCELFTAVRWSDATITATVTIARQMTTVITTSDPQWNILQEASSTHTLHEEDTLL